MTLFEQEELVDQIIHGKNFTERSLIVYLKLTDEETYNLHKLADRIFNNVLEKK